MVIDFRQPPPKSDYGIKNTLTPANLHSSLFSLFMSAPQQFTVNVPGAVQKDGETLPRRHFKFADALISHPEDVTTMWDVFCHGNKIAGGNLQHNFECPSLCYTTFT
jgi:hypothetical protein